jgi:hypothetical protein
LPRVPTNRQPTGFAVVARIARYSASELNGKIVAAKNVPIKSPSNPSPSSHSIRSNNKVAKIARNMLKNVYF